MVLRSFQCLGVLLLWHIVGQGPAVLAVDAGRVGCFFIYLFFFHLVFPVFLFKFLISWETAGYILKYFGLSHYQLLPGNC